MDANWTYTLDELDEEWMELILSALNTGISPDEIREFLNNPVSTSD